MALAGNAGTTQADKATAKAKQKKKLTKLATSLPAGPPRAPEHKTPLVTVGHVQHVHQAKVTRNRELKRSQAQHDVTTNADLAKATKFNAANQVKHKQSASDIYLKNPAALKAAGFKPEHEGLLQAPLRIPATAAKAAVATAKTIKEKPSTAAQLPVDLGKSLLSIPSGLIRSGLHPVKAAEMIAHDYSRRYGELYSNKPGASKRFTERQKKEGIAPEVLDAATVATAGGATAGRGLQKVAEAGALGKTAERVATAERPKLQISGQAVEQKAKGRNLFSNAVKHAVDVRRARKTQAVVRRAEKQGRRRPLLVAEAHRATEAGVPVVAPLHPKLAERAQRMGVGKPKGRAIVRQKVEQQTLDRELYKRAHRADEYAFKYATQYGIRSSKQAKEVLGKHLERVKAEQARLAAKGDSVPEITNEIPQLERLLKNPEVFDHELLHGAVRAGATAARKVAQESPGIEDLQAVERRLAPQAKLLGITRGEIPARAALKKVGERNVRFSEKLTPEQTAALEAVRQFEKRPDYLAAVNKDTRLSDAEYALLDEHSRLARVANGKQGLLKVGKYEPRVTSAARLESQTEYLARAQKEVQASGLKPGEYYPSASREGGKFFNRTVGASRGGAMAEGKAYHGTLTLSGSEHASLDHFANSLHQEIRRKHNWNLVNKIFETHTVPWSHDKTLSELEKLVDHHKIDRDTLTYVNVGKVQDARKLDEQPEFRDVHFGENKDPEVQRALDDAFVDPAYVAKHADEFKNTKFAIMPREVADELKSGFQQKGVIGRGYRVAKGSASRVLLSNPVWLQFQIMSNALMAGVHHPSTLTDAFKAAHQFKDPEWKALESDIGVHKFYDDRAHLGAASNNNRFVNAWRGWQRVGAGSLISPHPVRGFFNLFHRGDTAQNNFFRRAVLYNSVKRAAYRNMAKDAGKMVAAQSRIMHTLSLKDPQELMNAIIKDPHQFEEHAAAVDDFMGNWTNYTSRERQILGNVMFGGFLRFSTKLAFYTMPMRHPIMYSLALQMGRLEHDELVKIFGTEPPPWEIGNYYSEDGKAKFAAQRLNPFANALTQIPTGGTGNTILNSLPPVVTMLIDQAAKENVAGQQPWYINGKQIDVRQNVSAGDRAKMIAEGILKLSPFYRDVEKQGIPGVVKPLRGKQNSNSGLLYPSPRNPKAADAKARNEKLKQEQSKASPLSALTPFGDRSGQAVIQSSQDYATSQHKKPKKKHAPAFDILGGPAGSHSIEILP